MDNNFCVFCGTKVEPDSVFCCHCGRRISGFQVENQQCQNVYNPQYQPNQEEVIEMPPVETASWLWVLGTFFGAFIVLMVICMII